MSKKDYEKIIKENVEELLPALIERVLGLRLRSMEKVPFDVQITLERRPDFLLEVEDEAGGKKYLLHIEFQTKNEKDMPERMLEYAAILRRKHKKDIHQYVLYIGRGRATMPHSLRQTRIAYSYELIDLRDFNYEAFVQSDRPEEVILSILCNHQGHEPSGVVRKILLRLKELSEQGVRIDKYLQQLDIIANLRNLHKETVLQSRNMALTYDLTKDLRYLEGMEKGEKKGEKKGEEKGEKKGAELTRTKTLRKLLRSKPFQMGMITFADIAEVTEFSISEVKAMHRKMLKEDTGG